MSVGVVHIDTAAEELVGELAIYGDVAVRISVVIESGNESLGCHLFRLCSFKCGLNVQRGGDHTEVCVVKDALQVDFFGFYVPVDACTITLDLKGKVAGIGAYLPVGDECLIVSTDLSGQFDAADAEDRCGDGYLWLEFVGYILYPVGFGFQSVDVKLPVWLRVPLAHHAVGIERNLILASADIEFADRGQSPRSVEGGIEIDRCVHLV